VFRHACTEARFCFMVEDNICRLITNVKPELKLNKDLLPIASTSSPALQILLMLAAVLFINY